MDKASLFGKMDVNTRVHGSEESKVELVITEIRVVFVAKAHGLTASVKNGLKVVQSEIFFRTYRLSIRFYKQFKITIDGVLGSTFID